MSSEWPLVRLENVATRIGDGLHGTPKYDDNGEYYFINGNNLSNGRIVINEKTKRTDEEQYLKHKKDLSDRTIFVSINGTLGNIATYREEKIILGKSACYLNILPEVDKDYIKYVLTSKHFQDYIYNLATGSTIKNVGLKLIRDYEFRLPELAVQKKVSSILNAIDCKIENNTQTNQTLEQMAQAIFKSWFVDFEPVKAKMETLAAGGSADDAELAAMRVISAKTLDEINSLKASNPEAFNKLAQTAALFPAAMQDSELGDIPEGWEQKPLGSLIDFMTGFAFKSKQFSESGVRLARGDNVKEGMFYWGDKSRFWPSITTEIEKYQLKSGDILIGMDGSKVGKNWVRVNHSDLPCLLVQRVARLRENGQIGSSMLEIIVGGNSFKRYVDNVKTGTSIPHISGKQIKDMPVLCPDDCGRLFQEFERLLSPLAERKGNNISENLTLESIRNTLLPRLISGEL